MDASQVLTIPEGISADAALDAMTKLSNILKEKSVSASEQIRSQDETIKGLRQALETAYTVHQQDQDKLRRAQKSLRSKSILFLSLVRYSHPAASLICTFLVVCKNKLKSAEDQLTLTREELSSAQNELSTVKEKLAKTKTNLASTKTKLREAVSTQKSSK